MSLQLKLASSLLRASEGALIRILYFKGHLTKGDAFYPNKILNKSVTFNTCSQLTFIQCLWHDLVQAALKKLGIHSGESASSIRMVYK